MKWKNLLPIIGISIFIFLVYRIGITNLLSGFKSIKPIYFILFLCFIPVVLFLLTLKWAFILKNQDIKLSLLELFRIYMIGLFYGIITPAKAGSLIRAYYVKKKTNKGLIEISTSIVVERALDILSILFISIFGALFLFSFNSDLILKLIISFVILVAASIFFINEKRSRFIFGLVFKYILPKSLKEKIDNSFSSFYKNIPSPKNIVFFSAVTIFTWIVIGFQAALMMRAFSINISFLNIITIFLIAVAIGTIPITISGLGTREATLIALFSIFNISAAKVMSASIALLVIGSLIPAFIGFLLSLKEGKDEIFNNNTSSTK